MYIVHIHIMKGLWTTTRISNTTIIDTIRSV